MIERLLEKELQSRWNSGKVLIVTGPRQVGKTTLLRKICDANGPYLYLTGDDADTRLAFENAGLEKIKRIIQNSGTVFIDEAQRINNIGLSAKMIHDQIKGTRLLLSGSSALELLSSINEPLTGRKWEYHLYPICHEEIVRHFGYMKWITNLDNYLIYGTYPEVLNNPRQEAVVLKQLAGSYLYKDLLEYQGIRKPEILTKLLVALALQIGSEVSYIELAQLLDVDRNTVETYIGLLEKAFVIFRLPSLSRNLRNEIKSGRKIYFYDNGIRNALINNFNPLEFRADKGGLWENFLVSERMKRNHYARHYCNAYFWRTHAQQEIDYIEEYDGRLHAYEFKYKSKGAKKPPLSFVKSYPEGAFQFIDKDNADQFLSVR